jgi:hypothetical protein
LPDLINSRLPLVEKTMWYKRFDKVLDIFVLRDAPPRWGGVVYPFPSPVLTNGALTLRCVAAETATACRSSACVNPYLRRPIRISFKNIMVLVPIICLT